MSRGTTLVELVVALAILGLMAGMTGFAIHSLAPREESPTRRAIVRARAEALEKGRPIRLVIDTAGSAAPRALLFLPDGRVLGDTEAGAR